MQTIVQELATFKGRTGATLRGMAATARVDQSQLCQWMNGAPISAANLRKLVGAGMVTRETAARELLGPDTDAA